VRRRLDLLEGFHPGHADTSHYVRRRWPVRTTTTNGSPLTDSSEGRSTISWLYLAAPRVRIDPSRLVASGDWLNR
jgi:gamma-glutamylcyclotransferase (GGCT)/AIG2-like uncharacterized protein YtfP